MPSKPRALSLFAEQITSNGDLSLTGSPVFGDNSNDSVTFNGSAVSTPNGLNFDLDTLVIDALNNRIGVGTALPTATLHVLGSGIISADLAVNGGDITTSETTFNLINDTATSVNFAGAATALTIGATTGTTTVRNDLTLSGQLRGPGIFYIDPAAHGDNTGVVIIKGDLQVDGNTTTINSTTLTIDDKNIVLASGASNGGAADGAGITIDGAGATFTYVNVGDRFELNKGLKLPSGTAITAFSTDGTLINNSDSVVPTEKAVKTYVNDFQAATFEPTGFSRGTTSTMGVIEFSLDGTTVYSIDQTSTLTTRTDGKFATGTAWETAATARTIAMYPASGQTAFIIWQSGIKYTITTLKTATFAAGQQASHYFFFDQGTLNSYTSITGEYIQKLPFVSEVYCDEAANSVVVFGEERHGITMDGATHLYLHGTTGTRYRSGLGISGITAGATTYTNTVGGVIYDEDISISISNQNTNNMLYMIGTTWKLTPASNSFAYIVGGKAQYNPSVAGSYQLSDIPEGSYSVMYFMATNCRIHQTMKIMGQYVFTSLAAARESAQSEPRDTVLLGLPSPEFLYVGAVVVNHLGQVQTLDNGAVFVDLRLVNISAGTNSSSAAVVMTAADSIYDNTGSGLSATNVQLALTELAVEKVNKAGDTMTGDLKITNSGKLGIGTTAPSTQLHVANTGGDAKIFVESFSSGAGIVALWASSQALAAYNGISSNYGATTNSWYVGGNGVADTLTLKTANTERARISANGTVGIGTTVTTAAQLTVYNAGGNTITLQKSGGAAALGFGSETTANMLVEAISGGGLRFYTGSGQWTSATWSERMRIGSTGNVGIGVTNPPKILSTSGTIAYGVGTTGAGSLNGASLGFNRDVDNGDIYTNSYYAFQWQHTVGATGATDYLALQAYTPAGVSVNDNTICVNGLGNVGISTITPNTTFQVKDVGVDTKSTSVSSTSQTAVYTYSATAFRTAKLLAQVVDSTNSQYHSAEFLLIHNGSTVNLVSYGVVHTAAELGTFDADIVGGNVRLLFTATAATTKTVKVAATMMTA